MIAEKTYIAVVIVLIKMGAEVASFFKQIKSLGIYAYRKKEMKPFTLGMVIPA